MCVCGREEEGRRTTNRRPFPTRPALPPSLPQTATNLPTFGDDVTPLDYAITSPSPDVVHIAISAPGRWTLPPSIVPGAAGVARAASGDTRPPTLAMTIDASPFGVAVTRAGGNSTSTPPLFDSRGKRLVFKQAYIELTTAIPPTSSIYGLGERTSSSATLPLRRDGVPLALWARDSAAADADVNTYASWPVAWIVSDTGDTHAIALLSSNGMDVVPTADALTFRVTGGVIDLLILGGPTPAAVARQLATAIGFPTLQPLWAFGLMNSKYGYASAAQTQRVLDSYEAASIPLEAWVSDSQYMSDDAAFTWSPDFDKGAMKDFVGRLHATGRKWVPILDPVIHATRGYGPYDDGVAAGVFITDITGAPYVGQMWPGATVWPDFLDNDATYNWWSRLITQLGRDVGGVDGIWLDMNEVSNFCSGDVCRVPRGAPPSTVPPTNTFVCLLECEWGPTAGGAKNITTTSPPGYVFTPPYRINNAGAQRNMSEKTLAVSARHPKSGALEYDAHNLYGHTISAATAAALSSANHGRRPFLYTRSSFLGTGRYAGHWTGDTSSSWRDLQRVTPAVLSAGLAGIPFVGGDICGFMGVATPELCVRWVAAAAFHPFAPLPPRPRLSRTISVAPRRQRDAGSHRPALQAAFISLLGRRVRHRHRLPHRPPPVYRVAGFGTCARRGARVDAGGVSAGDSRCPGGGG